MHRGRLLKGIRLWGVRRIQVGTIARVLMGAALLVALFAWHWFAGAVTIVAAGLVYLESRLLNPHELQQRPPDRGWFFGGEVFAYAGLGVIGHPRQRQVIDQLATAYLAGETVELLVWVTTEDQTGQPWTLIQDQYDDASITASVVGRVPGACDPYIEAEELVMAQVGVQLDKVTVIGWGLDWSRAATRDVIVAIGQTRAEAGSFKPTGDDRNWQLVEIHPDSVARTLTRYDPRRWQAAAVWGLVTYLDIVYPRARALLEELVTEPWKNKKMFTRLGRLTNALSPTAPHVIVDPVVMSAEHGVVRNRRQARPRPKRALSWESPGKRTPSRYR